MGSMPGANASRDLTDLPPTPEAMGRVAVAWGGWPWDEREGVGGINSERSRRGQYGCCVFGKLAVAGEYDCLVMSVRSRTRLSGAVAMHCTPSSLAS